MNPPQPSLDPSLLDQLPALPAVALDLLRLADDPDASVAAGAAIVERDPALLASVMQTANSPIFAPRNAVVDAVRAVSVVGLRNLTLMGVGFAVLDDLWSDDVPRQPLAGLMSASVMTASAARAFSASIDQPVRPGTTAAGLLAFVGELALLRCRPERFGALWERCGAMPTVEQQHTELGADGVEVGSALMARWELPAELRDGVRIRALPTAERFADRDDDLDVALGFGTAAAERLTSGGSALQELRDAAAARGLGDDRLLGWWAEFRRTSLDTTQQLGLPLGSELAEMIDQEEAAYRQSATVIVGADGADEPGDVPVELASELDSARREIETLREENDRLEGLSLQDPLTGAPNRTAFEAHLRSALAQLRREPDPQFFVGVALFDLDHFKDVNDTHGHLVGDQLLTAVSSAGLRSARQNELFARLGGDEFAMILRPRDEAELGRGVERVRQAMRSGAQREGGVSGQTVSAGAAILHRFEGEVDAALLRLMQAADDALYACKDAGRDRCAVGTALADGLTVGAYNPR